MDKRGNGRRAFHRVWKPDLQRELRKNGVPFRELSTGHETFKADILPKGKLATIPTLLTNEGEVIRDGAAIIEHFEAANGRPCRPRTPRQQIVSSGFALRSATADAGSPGSGLVIDSGDVTWTGVHEFDSTVLFADGQSLTSAQLEAQEARRAEPAASDSYAGDGSPAPGTESAAEDEPAQPSDG